MYENLARFCFYGLNDGTYLLIAGDIHLHSSNGAGGAIVEGGRT